MNKKLIVGCLFCLYVIAVSALLFPAEAREEGKKSLDIDLITGLNLAYNNSKVVIGDNEVENTLVYSYAALELEADVADFLTVGVLAGLNVNSLKEPVDALLLPLSLTLPKENNNSMVFGVKAQTELSVSRDFSFLGRAEYLAFKLHESVFAITLPIASGSALVKNSFSRVTIDAALQYDGFAGFTVFAGGQFNIIDGEYKVEESIENDTITGQETLSYKQKSNIGFVGGALFEVGDHFTVEGKFSLVANTSFSLRIFYIF